MNLTKTVEYTLALTKEELLDLETILWEWYNPSLTRPSGPTIREDASKLAAALLSRAVQVRDGQS
jgi:hypothetical protein